MLCRTRKGTDGMLFAISLVFLGTAIFCLWRALISFALRSKIERQTAFFGRFGFADTEIVRGIIRAEPPLLFSLDGAACVAVRTIASARWSDDHAWSGACSDFSEVAPRIEQRSEQGTVVRFGMDMTCVRLLGIETRAKFEGAALKEKSVALWEKLNLTNNPQTLRSVDIRQSYIVDGSSCVVVGSLEAATGTTHLLAGTRQRPLLLISDVVRARQLLARACAKYLALAGLAVAGGIVMLLVDPLVR
jgi:hypothetical protein